MAISTGDILLVTARMTYDGASAIQNRFGVKVVDTALGNDTTVLQAVGRWLESIYSPAIAKIASAVSFDDYAAWNGTTATPLPTMPWPTLTAGTMSGDAMPNGTAVLCMARTGVARRFAKKYFPPPTEGGSGTGGWDASTLTPWVTAVGAWLAAYTDATNSVQLLGVCPSALGAGLYIGTNLLSGAVYGEWAYQRRRRRGRGI